MRFVVTPCISIATSLVKVRFKLVDVSNILIVFLVKTVYTAYSHFF